MKQRFKSSKYFAWDQLIVAVFVDPNVCKETRKAYCSMILADDGGKRGQMTTDWDGEKNGKTNVTIMLKADHELYKKHFIKCVREKF